MEQTAILRLEKWGKLLYEAKYKQAITMADICLLKAVERSIKEYFTFIDTI